MSFHPNRGHEAGTCDDTMLTCMSTALPEMLAASSEGIANLMAQLLSIC